MCGQAPQQVHKWFDSGVHIEIQRLTKAEFSFLVPRLVDIYMEAMEYPQTMRTQRLRVWRGEVTWPGFSAVAAISDNSVIGVAYGFLGARERWWDQQLVKALTQQRPDGMLSDDDRALLANYFEIAEVHVDPRHQGRGIGAAMLRELLASTSARWAVLSTPEVDGEANNAFGLYRKFGFQDVARNFYYGSDPRPFAILALDMAGTPRVGEAD